MAIPQLRPPAEPDHPAVIEPVGGASVAPVPAVPRVPVHKEDPNKQIQLDRMKRRATGSVRRFERPTGAPTGPKSSSSPPQETTPRLAQSPLRSYSYGLMFEELSQKLNDTLQKLTGRGVLTEDAVKEGLREIRRILLEADVSFDLTREFLERVQAKAVGESMPSALGPMIEPHPLVWPKPIA